MIIDILVALFMAIALVACVFGAAPERIIGALYIVWFPVDRIERYFLGPPMFDHVEPVRAAIDTLVLVLFTWLALRSNRVWPIIGAGAQCVAVGGYIAALVLGVIVAPFWAMTQVSGYVQMVALASGTWAHWRRVRRIGPYRSWRLA